MSGAPKNYGLKLPDGESEATVIAFQKKRMLHALYMTHGTVHQACNLAGIRRSLHYTWMREDPDYKESVEFIQEGVLDMVESKMFERIKGVMITEGGDDDEFLMRDLNEWPEDLDPDSPSGREYLEKLRTRVNRIKVYRKPPSEAMIAFYLRTRGRHRGYTERTEITGADGQSLFSGKTDEELVAMLKDLQSKLE